MKVEFKSNRNALLNHSLFDKTHLTYTMKQIANLNRDQCLKLQK